MLLPVIVVLATLTWPCPDLVPRVRGASAKEAGLIRELLDRSATARLLASEIQGTDIIAYVEITARMPRGRAATQFVATTERGRYLRVLIGVDHNPDDLAELLAHELQHVVEIGRAREVRDTALLRRLYQSIGEDRFERTAFETTAARNVAARVREELRDRPARTLATSGLRAGGGGASASASASRR